jgi:hypothetical protein
MWLRALAFWFGILMLAVANGALREGLLVPAWGVRTGQAASVLMLSTIVLFMARVFVRRAGLTRDRDALGVGLLWLALTLAFEFGFGRARGMPWETLLHDYDVSAGRVWPVVLLCTCVGPWLGLRLTRPPRADPARTPPRRLLGGLLAAIALNAVGGGLYGMSGAPEVPTAWLAGSPFADYTRAEPLSARRRRWRGARGRRRRPRATPRGPRARPARRGRARGLDRDAGRGDRSGLVAPAGDVRGGPRGRRARVAAPLHALKAPRARRTRPTHDSYRTRPLSRRRDRRLDRWPRRARDAPPGVAAGQRHGLRGRAAPRPERRGAGHRGCSRATLRCRSGASRMASPPRPTPSI